jgi:hypothetical protein
LRGYVHFFRAETARLTSAYADEGSPHGGEPRAHQYVEGIVAKRAAVPTDGGAIAAEFVLAGRIKHAGQDD